MDVLLFATMALFFIGFVTSAVFGINPFVVPATIVGMIGFTYLGSTIVEKFTSWRKDKKDKAHDEVLRDEALRHTIAQSIPYLYELSEKMIRDEIIGYSGNKSALETICRSGAQLRFSLTEQYSALMKKIGARYDEQDI